MQLQANVISILTLILKKKSFYNYTVLMFNKHVTAGFITHKAIDKSQQCNKQQCNQQMVPFEPLRTN